MATRDSLLTFMVGASVFDILGDLFGEVVVTWIFVALLAVYVGLVIRAHWQIVRR